MERIMLLLSSTGLQTIVLSQRTDNERSQTTKNNTGRQAMNKETYQKHYGFPVGGRYPQEAYTKDDDLYDDKREAEQHAAIEYLLAIEHFLSEIQATIDAIQPQALTIWDKRNPIRMEYTRQTSDRAALIAELHALLQAIPRYKDFICPNGMPSIMKVMP
jgi:hypothetical protein